MNPLTPYEQAILHLAHFDTLLHSVRMAADDVLKSRRKIGSSDSQEAVLSETLDRLAETLESKAPDWGSIK